MDTKNFLDVVLPEAGRRCIGVVVDDQFRNHFGGSNEWAAHVAQGVDAKGMSAYFACASYGPENKRKQSNVVAVRSFWLDIDTQEGKPKEKYASRREAIQQLAQFAADLGLNRPWIVDSGYGVHAYWPCDADMKPVAWKMTATLLKRAAKAWGLAADPSRTSDEASVLRPVGTANHKRGDTRPVRLLGKGAINSHTDIHLRLQDYLGEDEDELGERPAHVTEDINSDLMVKREYAPSDAHKIAAKCAVVREVRDTRGDVDQPTWYGVLGVLAFTKQGDEICHEWSDGYGGYSRSETQRKIEQARGFKPTTCEKLSECRPATCAACPWREKVRSPITLGTDAQPNALPEEFVAELSESTDTTGVPFGFPSGFDWRIPDGGKEPALCYSKKHEDTDDEGNKVEWTEWRVLTEYMLIPTARIGTADDLYSMSLRLRDMKGRVRDFIVDLGTIAEGGAKLFSELGKREVNVPNKLRPEMSNYLNAWIGKLREDYAKTPSIDQFGWHGDGFVLGNDYVTQTGTRKAMLQGTAASMGSFIARSGDLQTWVEAVDTAYNHPGDEPLQFCVLVGFAAPLWSMFGENGGVTVYAHSAGSGYGKTTAQMVGLSAWGLYPELALREGQFTVAGLYQHMGVMKNLPVVMDEFTNGSKEFASNLAYTVSGGKGKTRLNQDTSMKKTLNWSTIVAASGNNLITEKLSLHRADASAEMSRVWEFDVTKKSTIDPNTALDLFSTFKSHYGHAGYEFAKYVVENRDTVQQMLYATRKAFNTRVNISQSERYWSALHACILTALAITRKLGLLRFDTKRMISWIETTMAANRGQIVQNVSDPLEQFGEMLSDIFPGLIVTDGVGDVVNGSPAKVEKDPQGPITGRVINGDKFSRAEMYISTVAAKAWCVKKGVSFKEINDALVRQGWVAKTTVRRILGRGTAKYAGLSGPVRCWEVQSTAIVDAMADIPSAAKVQQVIQGGMSASRDAASGGQ